MKLTLLMSLLFAITSLASDWHSCGTDCRERTVKSRYKYGNKYIFVVPGATERVYLDETDFYKKRWQNRVTLTLTKDFTLTIPGGSKVTFPKGEKVEISQAKTIQGSIKSDTTINFYSYMDFPSFLKPYPIFLKKEGMFQTNTFYFYEDGTPFNLDLYDNTNLPVRKQVAEFGISVRFHPNGAVEYGRVYSDLYFKMGDGVYLFPGVSYQGGLIELTNREMPALDSYFGNMFQKI